MEYTEAYVLRLPHYLAWALAFEIIWFDIFTTNDNNEMQFLVTMC